MSKSYEDLTESEKLVRSTHFSGSTGPRLLRTLNAIQSQLDNLIVRASQVIKESFQVSTAMADDLSNVGNMLDVVRLANETDDDYRNRVITEASTFETVTVEAILSLYESLVGKRPTIYEPFTTKVYQSGEPTDPDEGGSFRVMFEVPTTVRSESLRVAHSGTGLIVTDDTIVSPFTTAVSATTSVTSGDTTIYAQDITNFPTWGELMIESEWVHYGSVQTSPAHAFLECVRGLYDSDPAAHNTDIEIVEGSTKVFLQHTNNQVYSSQTGTTIWITGGPYNWDTYFDVRYKITNEDAKEEYDTVEELGIALAQLQSIGYDFKAAGINADIFIGSVLRSWFQDEREVLIITDWHYIQATGIKFPEFLSLGTPPDTQVFHEAYWGSFHWDQDFWASAYWNGSTYVYFGDKEHEYVIITGD